VTLAAAMCGAAPACAGSLTAYSNTTTESGIQAWNGNLGLDFTVNAAVDVTAIGVFDDGSLSNLAGTQGNGVEVAIYNLATSQIVAGTEFLFTTQTQVNQVLGDAFVSISPVLLAAGNYTVVTLDDVNYNTNGGSNPTSTTNNGGGLLTFTGGGRFDANGSFDLPTIIDGGPVNRYDAGTFQYSAVPEPASAAVLIGGLAGMIVTRRRRRAA